MTSSHWHRWWRGDLISQFDHLDYAPHSVCIPKCTVYTCKLFLVHMGMACTLMFIEQIYKPETGLVGKQNKIIMPCYEYHCRHLSDILLPPVCNSCIKKSDKKISLWGDNMLCLQLTFNSTIDGLVNFCPGIFKMIICSIVDIQSDLRQDQIQCRKFIFEIIIILCEWQQSQSQTTSKVVHDYSNCSRHD